LRLPAFSASEKSFFLFDRDHFSSSVASAVGTNTVRLKRFVALGADEEMRRIEPVVGPTFVPP